MCNLVTQIALDAFVCGKKSLIIFKPWSTVLLSE